MWLGYDRAEVWRQTNVNRNSLGGQKLEVISQAFCHKGIQSPQLQVMMQINATYPIWASLRVCDTGHSSSHLPTAPCLGRTVRKVWGQGVPAVGWEVECQISGTGKALWRKFGLSWDLEEGEVAASTASVGFLIPSLGLTLPSTGAPWAAGAAVPVLWVRAAAGAMYTAINN